jgi:putrescine transport system permease protein
MNALAWLKKSIPGPRWLVIVPPYVWMLIFFAIPFLIVLQISFAKPMIASPPYSDLISTVGNEINMTLNLNNYKALIDDSKYLSAYLNSLKIAAVSTLFCLLIGYPIAYAISKLSPSVRNIALMLVILPSWTSFLIRIYAWVGILKDNGFLNDLLMKVGLIDQPLKILYTPAAVYIGIVYAYLPFMVLPLYANLIKHDHRLIEAAYDLGAKPLAAFFKITVPLSFAGIVAGCMLVFIPAVGEFVIPELLGGPSTKMIGKVLWEEYFTANDWPRASAIAIVMLLMLVIPIMIFHRQQSRQLESRLS